MGRINWGITIRSSGPLRWAARNLTRICGSGHLPQALAVIRNAALILSVLSCNVFATGALPTYVSPKHRATLQHWLETHSEFRLALDADCDCNGDLEKIRKGQGSLWKAQPNYHPFYAAGDFNSDGKEDFAVVLLKGAERYVAVFNGGALQPAYVSSKNAAPLFFGPPRPKPYRLITGNFWSEGTIFEPSGHSYVLQ